MKHLKGFNESLTADEVEELKEFCEINLAYLLDEDFIVDIDSRFGTTGNVSFNLKRESGFTWDEIKDHFIPFLQRLSNKYVIIDRIMISFQGTGIRYNVACANTETRVESLINNDIGTILPSETLIRRIFMRIVDKI